MTKDGSRGFRIYLGGGLGAASFIGHLLEEFTSEEKLLATCMAVIRLFDRNGNRENMARNRMRYLVNEMGWEKFQKMVLKERSIVMMTTAHSTESMFNLTAEVDEQYLPKENRNGTRLRMYSELDSSNTSAYERWVHSNVIPQKQSGYYTVFVTLGAGDVTASQLRGLARTIRELSMEGSARNTPQQNFAIRYVNGTDLREFYNRLASVGLSNPGALTITSAVGCSGTTSCNLAITNSHRLAKEIQYKFLELGLDTDDMLLDSTIKVSGCPNSCGQHEIATIGFFGGASRIGSAMAPTYTMMFGGSAGERGELGRVIMRVPAKRVIDTILKIIEIYRREHGEGETLRHWVDKILGGKAIGSLHGVEDIKGALADVVQLPPVDQHPEAYQDYGSDARFTARTAKGECAA
jgi:sulfite reductase (ferredoxin)